MKLVDINLISVYNIYMRNSTIEKLNSQRKALIEACNSKSLAEVAGEFHLNLNTLKEWLALNQTQPQRVLDLDWCQEVADYYSNHSQRDTANHFHVDIKTLKKALAAIGVSGRSSSESKNLLKPTPYSQFTSDQVDELRDLYLVQNKTYEEVREHFHLTGWTLDKILKDNGIRKSKKISAYIGLQTKYKNAGSREQYFQQMHEKQKQTYIERSGSLDEHYKKVSQQCSNTWSSKSWEEKKRLNDISMSHGAGWNHETSKATLLATYGVDNAYKLATYTSQSQPNKEFAELLASLGIKYQSEVYLPSTEEASRGFRYDFKVGSTLVEIDPWPFHNTTFSPIKDHPPISKNYHQQKSRVAADQGYRCLHVFDWDDKDKILQQLVPKAWVIGARRCKLREVPKEEVESFLRLYHFQGSCRGQLVCLGLYYEDQLIQLMTFGKPRYNKKYQWELLRLCTKPDWAVIGGAERLFKHFLKLCSPDSLVSYCDLSKFRGDIYATLGMKSLRRTSPSRHWYHPQLKIHITDNLLRQRGFDQLFGDQFGCYGKGTSNEELMKQHGFVEIYDCGQETFIWNNCQQES